MKKYLLIFALLLGAVSSWGQTSTDEAAVLQKIISIPELQAYYPTNADGSVKQLCISQFPKEFQADVVAAFDPAKVVFRSREAIASAQTEAYFVFRRIAIEAQSATATVNYLYDLSQANGQVKMLTVTISLQKVDNTWTITNQNIGGDTK